MKFRYPLLIALFALFITACNKGDDDSGSSSSSSNSRKEVMTDMVNLWVMPQIDTFMNAAIAFETEVSDFTQNPTEAKLESLKASWLDLAQKWVPLECTNVGQIKYTYLYPKIYTYPANTTKIDELAASAVDINTVSNAPSAAIGLAALEYLLFEQGTTAQLAKLQTLNYLDLLENTTAYLTLIGDDIADLWELNYGPVFADNVGSGTDEPVALMFNGFITALESLKNYEVGEPIGASGNSTDSTLLRAYYSNKSKVITAAQLEGLIGLYYAGDKGYDLLIREMKLDYSETLADEVKAVFDTCVTDLSATPSDWNNAVMSPDPSLETLHTDLTTLVRLNKSDVSSHLSLTITLSDSDGD